MRKSFLAVLCFFLPLVASAQTPSGEKVFVSQKCGVCHSVAGVGNKRGALDSVGSKLTPELIRQWIVNAPEMTAKAKAERKPLMKSYPTLP